MASSPDYVMRYQAKDAFERGVQSLKHSCVILIFSLVTDGYTSTTAKIVTTLVIR